MAIDRIAALLETCGTGNSHFPATDLFNEGWMLRLVLDCLSQNPGIDHDLGFVAGDEWYSEALLPSAFQARYRGDKLSENWTHADGVIGDFVIGANRAGDLTLKADATRIMVTEAKMFSKLSKGVTNAGYYNQAARNIACIAEVVCRAQIPVEEFTDIGFFVLAPESQIRQKVFAEHMTKQSIEANVRQRVAAYEEKTKEAWLTEWFVPVLEKLQIREISWEEIVELIQRLDPASGSLVDDFYRKCLEFNRFVANRS